MHSGAENVVKTRILPTTVHSNGLFSAQWYRSSAKTYVFAAGLLKVVSAFMLMGVYSETFPRNTAS